MSRRSNSMSAKQLVVGLALGARRADVARHLGAQGVDVAFGCGAKSVDVAFGCEVGTDQRLGGAGGFGDAGLTRITRTGPLRALLYGLHGCLLKPSAMSGFPCNPCRGLRGKPSVQSVLFFVAVGSQSVRVGPGAAGAGLHDQRH